MELDQFGFTDIGLMDGEHVDSALNLSGDGKDAGANPEAILLTDHRIVHIQGNGKRRRAVFASIQDIEAVEFGVEQDGRGAFIWAALAFLVAILLYIVIDHSIGRIAAAGTVALLGVYLVVDQLTTSGRPVVIFKAGSTQLRCDLETEGASEDAYTFINRLFQLKLENGPDGSHRAGRFATALIS